MKKVFAVALATAVIFSFASCDGGKEESTTAGTVTATDIAQTAEANDTTADITVVPAETTDEAADTTAPDVTAEVTTEVTTSPSDITVPSETTAPAQTTVPDETAAPDEPVEPTDFDFATADLSEYIALGKYLGIEVRVAPLPTITDEEIADELAQLTYELPKEAMIKSGTCKVGDKVNIDYVGTVDGTAFDGGSAAAQTANLGAGEYVEGFEEGIVGMAVGETRTVVVTFPDYYYSDLAGKEATFEITLNYIYPTLTDEIVAEYIGYDTVEELEAEIRASLVADAAEEASSERAEAAWTKVIANSHFFGYPEDAVSSAFNEQVELYRSYADNYGMTYEQFLSDGYGISAEEAESIFMDYAKNSVAQQLLIYAISRDMGMDVSDEAYNASLDALAQSLGLASADELSEATGYSKAYLKEMLIYSEVLDAIVKQANFVENTTY